MITSIQPFAEKNIESGASRRFQYFFCVYKSECWDLNPRPPLPQSGALPSCATSRCVFDAFLLYHNDLRILQLEKFFLT